MKKNKPTCSPWLHARLGEQLGLSPRSSGRVGGLSAGAQRTRRSAKGARLSGRGGRKQSSDPSLLLESGVVWHGGFSPCRYPATMHRHPATPVEIKWHHYQKSIALAAHICLLSPCRGSTSEFPSKETAVTFVLSSSRFFVTRFTIRSMSKTGVFCPHDGLDLVHSEPLAKFFEMRILPVSY
jgi:hypothetical protein